MEYFYGLDVAVDETAVCVVDEHGEVHLTVKVETDPDGLFVVLKPFVARLRRVGHEAGSLSPWLHPELLIGGLPAIYLETQHVRAAMSAQRNKTDAADALGIAHIMRTGWFRQAHIKTQDCYRMRLLLTHRRNLKRKFLDLENAVPALAEGVRHQAWRHIAWRKARYLACGHADRQTAGPRRIACDDAPSVRWKSAPRRFQCCE